MALFGGRFEVCDEASHKFPCRSLLQGEFPSLRLLCERKVIPIRRQELDLVRPVNASQGFSEETAPDLTFSFQRRDKWINVLQGPPTTYIYPSEPASLYNFSMKAILFNLNDERYVKHICRMELPRYFRAEFLEWHCLILTSETFQRYRQYTLEKYIQTDDTRHDIIFNLIQLWDGLSQYVGLPASLYPWPKVCSVLNQSEDNK